MILGAIVIAVALFSGLPSTWNTVLYVIAGLLIIIVAYLIKPAHAPVKPAAPYIEHTSITPTDHITSKIPAIIPKIPTSLTDTDTSPLP